MAGTLASFSRLPCPTCGPESLHRHGVCVTCGKVTVALKPLAEGDSSGSAWDEVNERKRSKRGDGLRRNDEALLALKNKRAAAKAARQAASSAA